LSLVKTIDIDAASTPEELEVYSPSPLISEVYVANENGNVTVIDTATDTIITTIDAGNMPFGVGVNSLTSRVYVSDTDDGPLFVIDATTRTVMTEIALTGGLRGVEVDEGLNRIFVASQNANIVHVINGANNAVIANVTVRDEPFSIGIDDVLHKAYVANSVNNTVSVINATNVVVANITVGNGPGMTAGGVGVNSVTHKAYVCNVVDDTISVIDTLNDTVNSTIPLIDCNGIGVNEATNRIYVSTKDTVSTIDGANDTVIDTLAVPANAKRGVDVDPNTAKIYISGFSEVFVLTDLPAQPTTTPVGGEILGIDMTSLFVAGAAANAGWIIPIAGLVAGGILSVIITKRLRHNQLRGKYQGP
jgi:YVTN family beta-propeller protein